MPESSLKSTITAQEIPESNSIKSNKPLKTSSILDDPPTIKPQPAIQETLQAEQPNSKQYKDRATPCHVTRPTDLDSKTLKSLPSLGFSISCHTLFYMKGMWAYLLIEIFCQIIQQLKLDKKNLSESQRS